MRLDRIIADSNPRFPGGRFAMTAASHLCDLGDRGGSCESCQAGLNMMKPGFQCVRTRWDPGFMRISRSGDSSRSRGFRSTVNFAEIRCHGQVFHDPEGSGTASGTRSFRIMKDARECEASGVPGVRVTTWAAPGRAPPGRDAGMVASWWARPGH